MSTFGKGTLIDRRVMLLGTGAFSALGAKALAADAINVGVLRFVSSGGLYLAIERGYFKAEAIDVSLTFFEAAQPIAVSIASGDTQFGLTGISGGTLNLAGRGALKIIASQGGEKKGYTGNLLVVSNAAFARGLTSFEALNGASVAISQVGSTFHYQLGQIADAKGFGLAKIAIKPLQSLPNMVAAVKTGQVDATILAPHIAGPLIAHGDVKLIGPLSDIADYQYGGLFTSPKILTGNRDLAVRFVRAYVRGLVDYNAALMRRGADGRPVEDDLAVKAGLEIGKYVYPSDPPAEAARKVIAAAVYCDPAGKVDIADIDRQISWYKSQKLVDASVETKAVVDTSIVP